MKKIFVLLTFLWWIPLFSQVGTVKDNLSLESKILNGERKYAIYLPPDYEFSERNYPVLYLLHGSGDDQTGWVQFGEVLQIADKAILQGNATSMIIVNQKHLEKHGYHLRLYRLHLHLVHVL